MRLKKFSREEICVESRQVEGVPRLQRLARSFSAEKVEPKDEVMDGLLMESPTEGELGTTAGPSSSSVTQLRCVVATATGSNWLTTDPAVVSAAKDDTE